MKLLYPAIAEDISVRLKDFESLEEWRRKHLLTYLAPVIMGASKAHGSQAAMDLLLAAEGLASDEALALRLEISLETVSAARNADKFWDFALAYYPDFEPLYINCLTTHEALLSWASSQ